MYRLILKDKNFRKLVKKNEINKRCTLFIYKNLTLSKRLRQISYFKLKSFIRDSSKTRVVNRCVLTGRSKAVFRQYKLSRIILRNYISNGKLFGLKKSSW